MAQRSSPLERAKAIADLIDRLDLRLVPSYPGDDVVNAIARAAGITDDQARICWHHMVSFGDEPGGPLN